MTVIVWRPNPQGWLCACLVVMGLAIGGEGGAKDTSAQGPNAQLLTLLTSSPESSSVEEPRSRKVRTLLRLGRPTEA